MERLQLILYVSLPLFGTSLTFIAFSTPWISGSALSYLNTVPVIIMLFFAVLDDMYRDSLLSIPVLRPVLLNIIAVGANVAFWLPVGHGIYRLIRRLQERRNTRRA